MRIAFNTSLRNAQTDLAGLAEQLAARQREVTSGKRVHTASQDPAAAQAAVGEHAEIGALDHYVKTANAVTSRLTIVDTVVADLVDRVTQASALLTSAQGSVLSTMQREALAGELRGIRDAIYTGMTTQFRGTYLFAGTDSTTPPYARNPDGSITAYQGNADAASVDVDRQTAIQTTFNGDDVLRGGAARDVFATLEDMIAAVTANDSAAMAAGSAELTAAFDRVIRMQSRVGTDLAQLDQKRLTLETAMRAAQSRLSMQEDANMVESISGMTAAETAYRAALGATSTIGRMSLLDYLR
ncbi:MAG: hypothetical protein Q8L86_03795 [Vicinamibacterales bacterium]|nr:hypothetical protein [Vicinamibacterales bacterium]